MKKAIGIHFGNRKSTMAFRSAGSTHIIRNKENEEFTPNYVGLRKNEIWVGRVAYRLLNTDPINTVHSLQKLIGRSIKDKEVQDMIANPYYKFGITSMKDGTDDAVAVILGGKQYTPEQLSAEILKKLKTDAEEKLGDEVTHAVITVPAYFTEKQKNATRIAAQLAGLKVQKLLAEPTAAAIAYGVDNLKAGDAKTVLIYDFGGGTFDLSILNIVGGQYMEAGTGGDRWLGGDDLDRALQTHILKRMESEYNISDINSLIENLPQKKKHQFEAQFRKNVEAIKIELSSSTNAQLIMDGFEDENGEWIDFDLTITREEFEKLAKPFVEKSIELIENLLKEVGYDISMIDNILLVGGTSCIPLVKEMLSQKYGNDKVKVSKKPMLAIAEGAGILSNRLGDECEPPVEGEISVTEMCYNTNNNYFIKVYDDNYDKIIERQMPLPCNVLRNYKTTFNNQLIFGIEIYADNEGGEKEKQTMGFFTIEEDLPTGSDIVLDFTLGIDEVFEVKAYPKTNKAKSKKIFLTRGNKDSKTLEFLANSLEKVYKGNYPKIQKTNFIQAVKKEIEKINRIAVDNHNSDEWDEIGTKIFTLFDRMKEIQPYTVSNEILSVIDKADPKIKNDFYYRYSIQLIREEDFDKAEKIITSHLNFQSSEIDKLNEILRAEKNNNAVKRVEEFNTSIEKLYRNSLSTEELKALYESLDTTANEVKVFDEQLSERISAIKPTLFNRLLSHYISAEQYGNAITIIHKFPKFWESPELLKNLGICCYGYTAKGLLTERNYQIVISGWLTSVFSDKVFLKSLDDTTWDDNYTFSLAEAIGSNYSQHDEIPDNVNYDEISETNISIGATQKELLQQFEAIIHKEIQDANLSKLVNDFYDSEKEAIENVIEVVENDIFFATPYFAKSNGINNEIIEELDNDYHNYSNENALEAGVPYIKNSNSSVVYQYFFANDLVDRVIIAINNENLVALTSLNTKDNKQWIEKFDNISSSVEDKIFNAIANKISDDDENEKLISVMEECISFSSQNEKLKHQYSSYVANYCISKVNNEEIDHFKALTLMKGAYLRSPNNPRVVKNFITLIRFNLMDILNDRTRKTTDIYTILDWVKNNMSQTYKQNCSELSKARREILQQLKQGGVDISLLDDDNPLSRLNLNFGPSLNAQGLKMKRALTYLKELGNEQESSNSFDPLRRLRQQLNLDDDLPF